MRKTEPKDFVAIYDIYMDTSVNPFMAHDPMDRESFRPVFDDIISRDYAWVFEEGGVVVGMCTAAVGSGRSTHVAKLRSLGIKQEHQGKGLGRKIVQEVIKILQSKSISRFELGVEADNTRGIAFYNNLGFVTEGKLKNYVKRAADDHYVDVLLMALVTDAN